MRVICVATGNPQASIVWNKDGRSVLTDRRRIQILRDGSLVIRSVTKMDTGVYTCIAANIIGSDEMSSAVNVLGRHHFEWFCS